MLISWKLSLVVIANIIQKKEIFTKNVMGIVLSYNSVISCISA